MTSRHSEVHEFEASPVNSVYDESPTASSVTGFSIANAVNLRGNIFLSLYEKNIVLNNDDDVHQSDTYTTMVLHLNI